MEFQTTVTRPSAIIMTKLTGKGGEYLSTGVSGVRTNWVTGEMTKNYYFAD